MFIYFLLYKHTEESSLTAPMQYPSCLIKQMLCLPALQGVEKKDGMTFFCISKVPWNRGILVCYSYSTATAKRVRSGVPLFCYLRH